MAATGAETHISWVLLSGDTAYKVLKPVRNDVLDHSTVAARRQACAREVELNRRLAPDVYRGVGSLSLDGDDLEPVVVMRRLPDAARLAALLAGADGPARVREVARAIAAFHARADVVDAETADRLASCHALQRRWAEDLAGLRAAVVPVDHHGHLETVIARIEGLASAFIGSRGPLLDERIADGMIRDGHGDLLADDIFCLADGPRILDCLAFDDDLRRGDVLADVAFLVMDIQRLGHRELAAQLLRDYDEFSGEHHTSSLAHLYVAQRALVRAKVAALRTAQLGEAAGPVGDVERYLQLVLDHLRRAEVRVVLVGGLPGTGKTTVANRIGDEYGWAVLSTDDIRRDLGMRAADVGPDVAYDPVSVRRVYDEQLARGRTLIEHGISVVLDASWTDATPRLGARQLADELGARTIEVQCVAPSRVCRQRIRNRRNDPDRVDTSEADEATVGLLADRMDPWPEAQVLETVDPVSPGSVLSSPTWQTSRSRYIQVRSGRTPARF